MLKHVTPVRQVLIGWLRSDHIIYAGRAAEARLFAVETLANELNIVLSEHTELY